MGRNQRNSVDFKFKTHLVQRLPHFTNENTGHTEVTYPRSASKLTSEIRGVWVLLPSVVLTKPASLSAL